VLKNLIKIQSILLVFILCVAVESTTAQVFDDVVPEESTYRDLKTKYWLNTYGNIRLSKKLFWVAQTHFRFDETENMPFAGQIAQVYNRHGLGYIVSKDFNVTLGAVFRLDFNTSPTGNTGDVIPEYRIWHQYQFTNFFYNSVIYHRFRIEHRWSRGFGDNDEYIFRNRWRYMFRVKVPLNKPEITSDTWYLGPEAELIMQSGKAVVGSPMEDLRLHTSLGYIFNPKLTAAIGGMYSFGQTLNNPDVFNQSWTIRMHLYFSPDFRKAKSKIPEVHFRD
jgi:hypothetical protein